MNATGLIVEYNPFHNGHLIHLQNAQKLTNSDITIAVMSGNFLQRGDVAIVNKWTRAKIALKLGIDIIIELPSIYAVQPAHYFAENALFLLNAVKCQNVVFGSEHGNINDFLGLSTQLIQNKKQFSLNLKKYLLTGYSYPAAADLALREIVAKNNKVDLKLPNNILGFHYVYEIIKSNSPLNMYTFKRPQQENPHHSGLPLASATDIRKKLELADLEAITDVIPNYSYAFMQNYKYKYGIFHNWEHYWPLLSYRLISMSPIQLRRIYEMKEGIEHRLINYAAGSSSFTEFINKVATKRYTKKRIKRLCVYILINLEAAFLTRYPKPHYLHLLGISDKGRQYLKAHKSSFTLPIFNKKLLKCKPDMSAHLKFDQIYYHILSAEARSAALKLEMSPPIQGADTGV